MVETEPHLASAGLMYHTLAAGEVADTGDQPVLADLVAVVQAEVIIQQELLEPLIQAAVVAQLQLDRVVYLLFLGAQAVLVSSFFHT